MYPHLTALFYALPHHVAFPLPTQRYGPVPATATRSPSTLSLTLLLPPRRRAGLLVEPHRPAPHAARHLDGPHPAQYPLLRGQHFFPRPCTGPAAPLPGGARGTAGLLVRPPAAVRGSEARQGSQGSSGEEGFQRGGQGTEDGRGGRDAPGIMPVVPGGDTVAVSRVRRKGCTVPATRYEREFKRRGSVF